MILRLLLTILLLALSSCSSTGEPSVDEDMGDATGDDTSSMSCAGCVLPGTGECVNGDSPGACGIGGETCALCDTGFCTEMGECIAPPECGPDNCEGCCDESGRCVDGEAQDECGSGGLRCENCTTNAACREGACVLECGPGTCTGCCDISGLCVPGNSDSSCGRNGGACSNCQTITSVCSDGICVAPDCAETCSGCCSGSDCIVVATANQCGSDGNACVACGDGRNCIDGTCVVDPDGEWTVRATSGVVVSTTVDGESWDGFNGLPDPYVEIEVAGQVAATDSVTNSLAPGWDEDLLSVTASDLFAGMVLRFMDSDLTVDDVICEITVDLDGDRTPFDGGVVESTCPDQPASFVRWTLTAR